jgi:ABC-type polysaccharide/polyol phosphate transport system ATPase subunit
MKDIGWNLLKKTSEFNFLKWGEYMKRTNEHKRKIETIKEMLKLHYATTTPMDSYQTGMYNGIEFALTILEERESKFKDVESVK